MEILGVGGAEFIAILIIMLVVAGPKRMIQWAYILGKWTAKARALWAESMSYIQKEFDEAGLDVQLPKEPPTRGSLNKQIKQQANKALSPVTKPVEDVLEETKLQVSQINNNVRLSERNGQNVKSGSQPPPKNTPDFGTWSGGDRESE